MAGYDFTYTIGLNAEFAEVTRKVDAFNKDLQSRNFDIKLDLAGYDNIDEVDKQLKKLGISTQELKNVTVETKTFIDAQGKSHQEVTKLITDHVNAYGKLEKVTTVVNSKYKETQDLLKKYDNLLKSTDTTLQGLQNVEGKHKDAIQKTATELNNAISKWKGLAEQYGVGSAEAKDAEAEIDRLSKTIKEQTGATKTGAAGLQSWATTAQRVIKQSFAYAIAMRAIRIAQQELNKAIKFAVDLNTEMTNIRVLQVEGARTAAEINNLADSFNRLAQEMGATTLEVAKGSVEWLRQGKTIEETGELLRSTIMLSKLGNLSAADSTKYLTSTLNGYKMEAEEAVAVVDKLVAVDNVAATSVAELATALQYSAAIANETGVSFEQLVSYIATVSETTRQNAESIGQGMKTMLTRMQDIKGGKLDEDSLGINNVEIALRRADVKLRDSKNSFRDFGGVLEELAGKWDGLTETEQAFIAKSIAGIRQVNMFTVLMQNMGRAVELQEVQLNSAGMSMERYQLYMESLQAKMSVFKATLEGLYQSAISSGLIEWFVELGTSVLKFIETIGGLKNALGAAGLIVVLIKVATHIQQITKLVYGLQWAIALMKGGMPVFLALTEAIQATTVAAATGASAFTLMNAAVMKSVAIFAAGAVALGILAYGIAKAVHTTNELAEEVRTLNTEISDLGSKNTSAEDLQKQYNELTIELSGLTEGTDEYTKKQQELYDVQNRLKSLFPELLGYYDAEGNFIIANNDLIQEQIDKLLILIELKKKAAEKAAREGLFKTGSLEPTGEKRTYVDPVTKQPFEQSVFEFSRGEGKYADFAAAFNKAAMGGDDTDYQSFITLLQDALPEDLNAFVDGATEYFAGVDVANEEGMLTTLEQIRELINQGNEQEKADKAAADVAKQNKENLIQYGGYNETQAENQIKYGDDSLAQIIGGELPSAIALFKDFDAVLEKISKNEIIPDDVILKLGALGVEYRILDDGTQQFYRTLENGTKDVVNSTDMLIDAKMAEIDENWKLSGAQKEVVRSYLEAAYAAEEQERALQKLNEEYEKTLSVSNLVAEAINEQSENQSISEETALALVAANGELANYITQTADGYTFASNEARNFANSQLIAQFAALQAASAESESAVVLDWLVKAQEAASQGNYYLAQSMLASASAAGLSTDALAQYTGIVSQLSQLSGAGFGVSSGGSGGSKENPAIKENEELIEQIEEQIELKEDEIDAYKKEIDLIKEAQDQYHDWLDQKKKSLELTKEENDYFKEQQKSLKELADIRKRIAELEFDTSEEARAKRLELEAEAAKMEEDIAENADDRRHDQQMEALDALKDSYDRMIDVQIKGIEDIITGIEDSIKLLRDQIEDIREIIADIRDNAKSGGGGSTNVGNPPPNIDVPVTTPSTVTDEEGNEYVISPNAGIIQTPYSNGTHKYQNSADYKAPYGTDVSAMFGGKVVETGSGGVRGDWVMIEETPGGKTARYYHLAAGTADKYRKMIGQTIDAGEIIGQSGLTGRLGGTPHYGIELGEYDEANARGNEYIRYTPEYNELYQQILEQIQSGLIDPLSETGRLITEIAGITYGSVADFNVKITNANGEIDTELSTLANDLADAGVMTQQGFEDVEEALRNGGITLDDGISGVMEDLEYLGIGAGLTGQGLIALYKFIMDSAKNISEGGDQETFTPFTRPTNLGNTGYIYIPGMGQVPLAPVAEEKHDGGLIESHHNGEFAGGLQSNEVFAKLLKGEYVATEHQMDNFLRNVLPSIGSNMPKVTSNIGGQSINVSMPITVEGNLDKSVIPDIKNIANQVIAEINRSLISRGYVRPANQSLS